MPAKSLKKAIENLQQDFARIRNQLHSAYSASDWINLYRDIMRIDLLNEKIKDEELKSVFKLLKEEVNMIFAKFGRQEIGNRLSEFSLSALRWIIIDIINRHEKEEKKEE